LDKLFLCGSERVVTLFTSGDSLTCAHCDEERLTSTIHQQQRRTASGFGQRGGDVTRRPNRLVVDLNDHVAWLQSSVGRRSGRVDVGDHNARCAGIESKLGSQVGPGSNRDSPLPQGSAAQQ